MRAVRAEYETEAYCEAVARMLESADNDEDTQRKRARSPPK